ncbi:Negative regulator of dna transposition [Apiospora marii]|uniref:Negative regulator of dna transposition n=1 Tax=Apiospora marii TaxID=335849 RepID=A0ABR1RB32_9PEZI
MSGGLDTQKLGVVFKSRPDILKGIEKAADEPSRVQLFNTIADFVYEQIGDPSSSEPALKRRRVDIEPSTGKNGAASNGTAATSSADVASESILLEIKDISVSVPQRKKFDLCFTAQHLYARLPNTTAPVAGMIYAWKDIEYAFYLPVPEKTQVQHNYVLFPANTCLSALSKNSTPSEIEPLVFTVSAGAPKPGAIGGPNASAASAVSDSYSTLFHWAINKCLQAGSKGVHVVEADPAKFHSLVKQSHRPKEKAVHVKAFRGSKDGYLFFLENGILWGFKKPLIFMPLDRIVAISYTSVLQRTFNMVVEIFSNEGGDTEATEEVEFAMIDQEDYGGISEKYGAEGAEGEANGGAEDDGLTELERAAKLEQQLQDDEDEEEEDYDPGSDADSDGSGASSEDDDDDDEEEAEGDEMDEEGDGDEA